MASTALPAPSHPRWQTPADPVDDAPYPEDARSGFDIRQVWAAVRRRQWWILGTLALAVALAVLATMLQSPRYTAETTVQINDQSERVLGDGDEMGNVNNLYDVDRFLKTQVEVLNSRALSARVAQKLQLVGNERFYEAMEVTPPEERGGRGEREMTLSLLQGNLNVDLPFDTRIATIEFTSGDAELSAQIANTYAAEFIQSNLQRRYDSSAYAREFVSGQLADAKERLEESERGLNAYARQAGLIRMRDPSAEGESAAPNSVTTASLVQINQAANQARSARIAAEQRWRTLSEQPLMSSREVMANAAVQNLMTQRAALEANLQEERARRLDDYPGMVELRAQVAEVNRQLEAVANNVRSAIRADYTAAVAAENALQAQVGALKGDTLAEQDRSVQYNLMAREADTNRSLYDGLLQRYKELNASAGVASSNVAIIDQAEPPMVPSSPNLMKNIFIGLLLGGIAASALVFLTMHFDDAIRVPEDVEGKLSLPLLGVIPYSGDNPAEALRDPKSPISEGYNALRASLLHSTTEGLPPVLLVTSAQASEGKTTTSTAIATTLARLGRNVLLVDGDLRRPSVHHLNGGRNERGLSDLLTSIDPLESAVVSSQEPRLDLLTSGPLPPSPTELTSSNRFRALIDEMADKYDSVIIDSPPILGLADAPSMSTLADGVVVVVESGRSRRGGLKAAIRRLRTMRPVLLGVVLTKFDNAHSANRYSEYYGTSYYAYESRAERA